MAFSAPVEYTLFLADTALILGHRNSEWTGHGPILEQDIALSNIALDLIGQARWLYQHAAHLINTEGALAQPPGASRIASEDGLAYGRDGWDFRNCLLVEQPNGDWGKTIMRQFLFSAWQLLYFERLRHSHDRELAAIAAKSVKEVTYHLRWSSEWVIRLGDGTEESHDRMQQALGQLWPFTGEFFLPAPYEETMTTAGVAVDAGSIRPLWTERVEAVLAEARLSAEAASIYMHTGGKLGKHTEHLGYLLAEMQFLQRAYPNCEW